MPKSRSRRNRKGGFSFTNPFASSTDSTSTSYSQPTTTDSSWGISNLFGKKDQSTGYGSMGSQGYTSSGMGSSDYTSSGFGGKRRRRMRGGSVSPNMSLTNLASSAAPISGGRTRRRRHRHTKSCKKSCKKH